MESKDEESVIKISKKYNIHEVRQSEVSTFYRNKFLGIICVLLTNIVYISSNYIVKWGRLEAGEVTIIRGPLQVLVFSCLALLESRRKNDNEDKKLSLEDGGRRSVVIGWTLAVLRGLMTSSMSFACIMAVPLMPIGDLIVLCFISPVFSVILEGLILKRPLTILSLSLCVLICRCFCDIGHSSQTLDLF